MGPIIGLGFMPAAVALIAYGLLPVVRNTIASGLSMTVDAFILLGAIPAALLAILTDYVLGRLEGALTPRGLLIET